MSKNAEKLVKIQFYESDVGYENLWAAHVKGTQYRIESIPFFVYGISLGDIVTTTTDKEGRLQFKKVLQSSGHKTLRARSDKLPRSTAHRNRVIAQLKKLGSMVELHRSRLLAIDVPLGADIEAIIDFLTNEANISWEYGNPEELND